MTKRKPFRIEVYEDDVFLVSYPRSGNTWIRFLVANLMHPGRNLGNDELMKICPDIYQVDDWSQCERPRIIKSHEMYMPEYPKVIYIYRDGRDAALSYYFYHRKFHDYEKDFPEFIGEMLRGDILFGSWHRHIEDWLFREHEIDFLPVKFEDLHNDMPRVLKSLGQFLNVEVSEKLIKTASKASTQKKQGQAYRSSEQFLKKFPKFARDNKTEVNDTRRQRGVPDTWGEFFSEALLEQFWEETSTVMEKLGYSK